MAHSYSLKNICGNHNNLDVEKLKEIVEITTSSPIEKILTYFKFSSSPMIVFDNDPDFNKVNLTFEGSNVITNSWVECAYYVNSGWIPPGYVFSDGQQESYMDLLSGYYFNHSYITYVIFLTLILFRIKNRLKANSSN